MTNPGMTAITDWLSFQPSNVGITFREGFKFRLMGGMALTRLEMSSLEVEFAKSDPPTSKLPFARAMLSLASASSLLLLLLAASLGDAKLVRLPKARTEPERTARQTTKALLTAHERLLVKLRQAKQEALHAKEALIESFALARSLRMTVPKELVTAKKNVAAALELIDLELINTQRLIIEVRRDLKLPKKLASESNEFNDTRPLASDNAHPVKPSKSAEFGQSSTVHLNVEGLPVRHESLQSRGRFRTL